MNHAKERIDGLRESFSAAATDARPTDACPEAARLWEACRGELPAAETRDIVDHTASCAACAEAWRLARALEDAPAASRTVSAGAWKRWRGLAAAAAIVLLALVGLQQIQRLGKPEPPVFRQSQETAVVSLVAEDDPLARDRCLLRWSSPVEDARFDVYVATETLVVVAEARGLTETEFLVPAEALGELAPGAKLLWHVESISPDGERIVSTTFLATLE